MCTLKTAAARRIMSPTARQVSRESPLAGSASTVQTGPIGARNWALANGVNCTKARQVNNRILSEMLD